MQTALVAHVVEKILRNLPLVVEPPEYLNSKLDLIWNTFLTSDFMDRCVTETMQAIMEDCGLGFNNGPYSRNDSLTAFFDFNRKLAYDEAVKVTQQVAVSV